MKKFIIGLLVVAVLGVGGYYAYTTFFTSEEAPKQEARKTTIKKAKEPEKAGEAIKASDYSNADNWLAKPTEITSQADVFMLYPTAYAQKK